MWRRQFLAERCDWPIRCQRFRRPIAALAAICWRRDLSRRLSPCCLRLSRHTPSAAGWFESPTLPSGSRPGDLSARIQEESTDEIAHVASALDKTARKLEDGFRALENSRQTLEALLNSMQEAVIAVAQDGRVLWANQRMERLLPSGVRLGAPLVQSLRDPEILMAVQNTLDKRDVTVANAAKIFSGRIFDVTAAPMPGGGAVAVLHDQTDIERVEKTRRDFIANVSHELRTPLTSIQGYSETLLDSPDLRESGREFVDIIRKNAMRMARLTEDLLVLARVESGEQNFNFQAATPRELLEDALQTFQDLAASRGIELSLMNTATSTVSVDRDAIHQVFSNLIDNALKYGDAGGKILVGACDTEDGVQFYVRDFGSGISSEHLPRLFERFYRVDKARSRESGGTGLGLAIAKHVVRAHSGTIRVESSTESRLHLLLHPAPPACSGQRLAVPPYAIGIRPPVNSSELHGDFIKNSQSLFILNCIARTFSANGPRRSGPARGCRSGR